jgi:outer membrane lipoprotein-sorting protein
MIKFKAVLFILSIIPVIYINAQSVDKIISKSLAARGGIEKIKAVKSQRMTGQIEFSEGAASPLVVSFERPGKIREEIIVNGKQILQINNGKEGWVINPFSGSNTPHDMTDDEIKNTSASADIDGPLVDYKERGNQIEFSGIENINGKAAYKLLIKQNNGQTRYDYIDTSSYLEVKWEGNIFSNGNEIPQESFFSSYKDIDGLMYAFEIDSDSPGGTNKQKIIFDKVEVNPELDKAAFEQPVVAPADSTKQ